MPVLSLFGILVSLAAFALQVASVSLMWPTHPEANHNFSLRWSGGTSPYTLYVLAPDLQKYYYKYQGPALITYWNFNVAVGTPVVFQVMDVTREQTSSPLITVVAELFLKYPADPSQGGVSNITWGDGFPPYTVSVLTPDLSTEYWSYSGSQTDVQWPCSLGGGTKVVFRATDENGINVTSNVVTVQANDSQITQSSLSVESITSLASIASIEQQSLAQASLSSLSVASTASVASLTSANSASGNHSFTASTPPATSTNSGRKSSNENGAIVGGAVGGAVGLGIIAFLAFLIARKFRNGSTAPDSQPAIHSHQLPHENPFATPPDQHAGKVTVYAPGSAPPSGVPHPSYNPSYSSSPHSVPPAYYSGRAEVHSAM